MSKKFKSRSAKYRSAIFAAMAVATSFAMFAGACSQPPADSGEEDTDTSTRVDEQVLKNGNFEFFEDNDGTYVIGTPDNWSSGTATGATASHSKSGVIGTDGASWSELTDPELPQKLWDNAKLETDDENYVNYSADPEDLPFKDPASAIVKAEEDDEEDYIAEGAEYIANPHTHDYRWDGDKLYGADGSEITYYEDGKMGYKFSTPHMERYEFGDEPYMEFKEGIHIITFDENGKERSDLVADYAKYIESKGLWEAKGNVRGRDNEGKELYTEQLFWDENSDKIYSNVDTKVVNGDEVTLGSGFESDGQLNNVRFLNTKGRLLVDTTRQAQPTVQNQ